MIPERIFVEGFLCYREPQEACFDGRTLWMLAGPNGSGKSALFDAVTFTLYAQHRAGRHHARGLINSKCDGFVLEFDFSLENVRYRARRTLSKYGRPTRQIYRRVPGVNDESAVWHELAETHTEQGFMDWVRDNIALTYETFTASVLLLQGKADNLLLATPAQRHALLRQIVGMERCERIDEQARLHLTEAQGAVKSLRRQLKQAPRVTTRQLKALEKAVEQTTASSEEAARQVDQTRTQLENAERWIDLTQQSTHLRHAIDKSTRQCERLKDREERHDRLKSIHNHVEQLTTLVTCHDTITECRTSIEQWTLQNQTLQASLTDLESNILQCGQRICCAEQRLEQAIIRSRGLMDQRSDAALALSPLRRLNRARQSLLEMRQKASELDISLQQFQVKLKGILAQTPTDSDVAAARSSAQDASQQLVRAQTDARQLRQQLDRFQSVAGEKNCRYCQQPLPESHVRDERTRLKNDLGAACVLATQIEQQMKTAEAESRSKDSQLAQFKQQQTRVETQIRELTAAMLACRQMERESQRQCNEAYREIPARYQHQVAGTMPLDWAATTYPTPKELETLSQAIDELESELQAINRDATQQKELIAELVDKRQRDAEKQTLLERQIQQLALQVAEKNGQLTPLEDRAKSTRGELPLEWQSWSYDTLAAHLGQLRREQATLKPAETSAGITDLQEMREQLSSLNAQQDAILNQMEKIPDDARCDPESIRPALVQARRASEQAVITLCEATNSENSARENVRHYETLSTELRENDRQHQLWTRLAELLGRDHLQYEMLRAAERAIVEYANVILDRLSSGQLYIELRNYANARASSYKALDLLARTAASPAGYQDVAFLSGSQKFRVAVSLSLAIGQFASRTRRPVQAVIIDEGFGCLDNVNRQVMIQELQNLRSQLQRILLVSHQDEFTSAFSDGYRCEIVDGTTRLAVFHR